MKRRTKNKGEKRLTSRMETTRELVKEGYSNEKAMELAGYAQSTVNTHCKNLLDKLDLPGLLRGLKPASAILNYKAIKVLNEETDKENSRERIRAADVAVKMGKLHLGEDKAPPVIKFHSQTINKAILVNTQEQQQPPI